MAFGDIGGAVTELVITCKTPASGVVDIKKGDAVIQVGDGYTINTTDELGRRILGEALASTNDNNCAIPVRVKGVLRFALEEPDETACGLSVCSSWTPGRVRVCRHTFPTKKGEILCTRDGGSVVEVLI